LGCTSESAPLVVTFTDDLYPVTVRPDTTLCLNQSVTLTANSSVPGDSYTWSPATGLSAPTSASTIASPTDTTLYTVYVTYGVCTDSAKVTIRIDKNLAVDAGGPLDIIAGQSEQATAIVTGSNPNLSTILWTPATGLSATNVLNPVVTPVIQDGTTTYQITVTNTNGCTATDQLTVNVIPNVGCENVRNAFSPNGDGINDMWLVYDSYSCLTNVTVAVFNRYGSRVFESKDYRNLWDGKYKGKELPDGTYYAIVEFKFRNGKSRTVRTDLTLLR
jgi:gliding motility-associated-like protein